MHILYSYIRGAGRLRRLHGGGGGRSRPRTAQLVATITAGGSVTGWLHVPYVSDEESNDDLGGSPERRDSPMPSPLRAGSKHASTPKSRCKGKKSRGGGNS